MLFIIIKKIIALIICIVIGINFISVGVNFFI